MLRCRGLLLSGSTIVRMNLTWLQRLQLQLAGWKGFRYPATPSLPPKPWHPDEDYMVRALPKSKLPDSDKIIAHLKSTGRLVLGTGTTVPKPDGRIDGYPLNAGLVTDQLLTITKEQVAAGRLTVATGFHSSYGAKLRYAKRMIVQGEPMIGYSDSKLHVFDAMTGTITEVQNFRAAGAGYACDGATQFSLDEPSTMVTGRSSAKLSLAEHTLRYDDLIIHGWRQRTSMGVVAGAKGRWIYPAQGSDAESTAPDAPAYGTILVLKPSAISRLAGLGYTRQTNPQAYAVMDCWKLYGIIIVDRGGNNASNLEPDNRWDQKDLSILSKITIDDFEAWTLLDSDVYRDVYEDGY